MYSRCQACNFLRASVKSSNPCTFRHSSRSVPLNDSIQALSVGFPVREEDDRRWLFDLINDPDEQVNLVDRAEFEDVMNNFDERILEHMEATGDRWDLEPEFPPPDYISHEDAAVLHGGELLDQAVIVP